MEIGVKVGDLMTRNFIYVSLETNLEECARTMVKKRVGSVVIREEQKLKGILTKKDIIWAVVKKSKEDLKSILAKDLMKRKVVTIKPGADISDAMERFKKKKIRRLPVVENGKLIGMLTLKDVLKIDPGLFQLIAETMKIREETSKLNRSSINAQRKQGVCEECGEYDLIYQDEAQWICDNCYSKR
ncbi:CBS domain-containing protein [Candidatus Pacearchaeota archaeon]|nr:CBS domain-containing protein [Candidatus Pacearchaeota archaeon]